MMFFSRFSENLLKRSTGRSLIFIFVLFLGLSCGLWADEEEKGWVLGPTAGIHWGRASEIVYDTSGR